MRDEYSNGEYKDLHGCYPRSMDVPAHFRSHLLIQSYTSLAADILALGAAAKRTLT